MPRQEKKSYLSMITGAIISVLSLIVLQFGYSKRIEDKITSEDTLIILGLITLILGILILCSGIYSTFKKQESISTSQSDRVKTLTQAALLSALCYIGFQFFKIDIPVGTEKTAFHLGNTFCVLAALLLGGFWGGLAGSIGMTIADLTSSYVTSAPKTFLLKLCIGLIVGLVAHKIFHISKEKSKKKIFRIALISSVCGMTFNVIADPVVGYFYKRYLLNIPQDVAAIWAKMGAATTFVNAIVAVIVAVIIYTALRPALTAAGLFREID